MASKEEVIALAQELFRLYDCAEKYRDVAHHDPDQYVDAVKQHYADLIIQVAQMTKVTYEVG